uniref:Uncharacterized protein n=1 Tax=Manihot esculenta TaxID=3983 RepID=A0A2C9UHZ6_MANES
MWTIAYMTSSVLHHSQENYLISTEINGSDDATCALICGIQKTNQPTASHTTVDEARGKRNANQ